MSAQEKPVLGVFGAGWVGLVTATCFAELGLEAVVRDVVPERIATLSAGRVPFHEPGLEELLARNRGRLRFTLDAGELAAATDIFFVCVDTPPTASGDADLSRVWTVLDDLGSPGKATLVMKSTVPVGTGEKVRAALDARGLGDVGYVSNPEFLAEGRAVRDFMEPDRIVIGAFDERDGDRIQELYAGFDAPVVRTDVASAEMIKLAANAFLATRISFINEIANVCEVVGADVEDVARGMGLDRRVGTSYLRPGIGYGGSCLAGEETVLARAGDRIWMMSLDRFFADLSTDCPEGTEVVWPEGVDVLAWDAETDNLMFLPVQAATRRRWDRSLLEIRTKMGRRVRCTPDHPFLSADGAGGPFERKLASELTSGDWLPLAQAGGCNAFRPSQELDVLAGMSAVGASTEDVIVRPARGSFGAFEPADVRRALESLAHPRARARSYEILRTGALRLHEAGELGIELADATYGTSRSGRFIPSVIDPDDAFWFVVGLYLAEGHATAASSTFRLTWSFHRHKEPDLVQAVLRYWRRRGVRARLHISATAANVIVTSRLLVGWWRGSLGLGAHSYAQRIPDLIWSAPNSHKRALLAGMWRGDGSWSYVSGGPSVVLEYGTASRELADGLLRLLGDLGVAARLKVGRTRKSTVDTYWLTISGANQVEELLDLVPARARDEIRQSLRRQKKGIAPTGYRLATESVSALRVVSVSQCSTVEYVYSLEVPGAHNFVTTGGLIVSNCFPKDVSFLKLLAGNSGYHFQLVSAVIEVNELQKRRVIQKLQKHLGPLRGKTIALLGLAFKPNTDDMREAPSIVLAARLLSEGAEVRAWDPLVRGHPSLNGVAVSENVLDAVRGADAAVIVTEWPELEGIATPEVREAMRTPLLVDGRNLLDPEAVRKAGFQYEGIGRA